ncbi:MAG: hypothetical protein M0T85_00105 [Dehalococcoidales bacterium]|nr:hypothetical protein [Dehalococcoidales bacterium]
MLCRAGKEYEELNVAADAKARVEMFWIARTRSVPVIVIDGQAFVGFEENLPKMMAPIFEDDKSGEAELITIGEEGLVAKLRALEEELDDVLEQRRVALARPMRGSEKDNLRRQFARQEARLRERIEAIRASLKED